MAGSLLLGRGAPHSSSERQTRLRRTLAGMLPPSDRAVMLFASDQDDDIDDAVKELADMFGKKLRPFLPDETKISRPSLVEDEKSCKALNGMHGLSELRLSCEGRPLRVVLFEAEPDMAAAG